MKYFVFVLVWMIGFGCTTIKQALTQPNVFTIQCTGKDAMFKQTDPNRVQVAPHYEGSVEFKIAAGANVHLKKNTISWNYPTAGGSSPSWGAWTVSSSKTELNWSAPTGVSASGNFRVTVNGKFTCGEGNGGKEYTFSGYWDGNLNRDWEANPAIKAQKSTTQKIVGSHTENLKSNEAVRPGDKLKLILIHIEDKDTHKGANPESVLDTTKPVTWSDSSETSSNNFTGSSNSTDPNDGVTASVIWTVPPFSKFTSGPNNEGWIEVTATIDDVAPAIGEGESGSRDDKPLEVKFLISVTGPRAWERTEEENQSTNIKAKITKPVEVEVGDTPPTINAKAGDTIKVSIEGTDEDYWTRTTPNQIDGKVTSAIGVNKFEDMVWTAKSNGNDYGEFSEKNKDGDIVTNQVDNSTSYHIPSDAQPGTEIVITAKADDHGDGPEGSGDALPPTDTGNRDDDPITLSFKIKISKDPGIQSIELTPENPITSGYQNSPAASLDFNAKISDPEDKVTSVHWDWGGQTHVGNPWHIDAVPYDKQHGSQSVTCTIYWDDNGTQKSDSANKDFKLFFDHSGHDESNDTSRGTNGINPPNWFDDTTKHWGEVMENKISGLDALKSAGRFFYSNSIGGTDHSGEVPIRLTNSYHVPVGSVVIAPVAGGSISPQPGYVYTARTSGIDSFGAIILHEMQHRKQLQQSWGLTDQKEGQSDDDYKHELESKIGPNGTWIFDGSLYDKDADGMRDSWEMANWQQPDLSNLTHDEAHQFTFLKNQQYDGNSFEQDNEFDADMEGARKWMIGSADDDDWANTGKQADEG